MKSPSARKKKVFILENRFNDSYLICFNNVPIMKSESYQYNLGKWKSIDTNILNLLKETPAYIEKGCVVISSQFYKLL